MIATLTEAECFALTIPATDELLRGWVGPSIYEGRAVACISLGNPGYVAIGFFDDHAMESGVEGVAVTDVSLPLSCPEVQALLVGWLGRGERCPRTAPPTSDLDAQCPLCADTGYLRPRYARYAWLTPQAHGGLPDWIRLALIWGSVVRVAAGMGPLGRTRYSDVPKRTVQVTNNHIALNGFRFGSVEEAEAEIARCNAAALAKGDALVESNPDGRVIRFDVFDVPDAAGGDS